MTIDEREHEPAFYYNFDSTDCEGFWQYCLQKLGSEFYVYENKSVRKRGL